MTGLLTLTSEIDAAALAHVEALFEKGYHHARRALALTFLARFAKDSYVDAECARLSSLWLRYAAPDQAPPPEWLTKPGWISEQIEALRVWLADGDVGVVPEFRVAVEAELGARWHPRGAPDEWGFFDKEEDADDDEKVLPSAEKAAGPTDDEVAAAAAAGGPNSEDDSTDGEPEPVVDPYAVPEGGGEAAAAADGAAPAGAEAGAAAGAAAGGDAGGDAADEAADEKPKLGNRIEAPKRGSIVRISEVTEQLRVIGPRSRASRRAASARSSSA